MCTFQSRYGSVFLLLLVSDLLALSKPLRNVIKRFSKIPAVSVNNAGTRDPKEERKPAEEVYGSAVEPFRSRMTCIAAYLQELELH